MQLVFEMHRANHFIVGNNLSIFALENLDIVLPDSDILFPKFAVFILLYICVKKEIRVELLLTV